MSAGMKRCGEKVMFLEGRNGYNKICRKNDAFCDRNCGNYFLVSTFSEFAYDIGWKSSKK
jgi:hypothetical protein